MGNFIAVVHGARQVMVGRILTMDGNGSQSEQSKAT